MLRLNNICYRYTGRKEATLKDISLHIGKGEMLLLAGRSGSGKSTLIKVITGLLSSSGENLLAGSIYIDGHNVTKASPEAIGVLAGTLYQTPDDQLFAMSVADEVAFALENRSFSPEFIEKQVEKTLKMVGLEGYGDCSINRLSGGQRQRLALASILVTEPGLLILDEPVSQMNPQGVESFLELLKELNHRAGISILMVEHRVNELASYFKRLAIMENGSIVYDGTMKKAWSFLTGKERLGLREPDCVKLGRLLNFPLLSASIPENLSMLQEKYLPHGKAVNLHEFSKAEQAEQTEQTSAVQKAPVLQLEHVFYTYPSAKKATLKDISFNIAPGSITALMGFNGAGKSTLFNLIGGLTEADTGKLLLDGKKLSEAAERICYLMQEPDLMLLADSVLEEVLWNNKKIAKNEAEELLQKLDLLQYENDFPQMLSKGQRLRLMLGAMLARRPSLLLLDEPTTGQDEVNLQEIKKLLKGFRQQGGSVFICTHDLNLTAEIADSVLVLADGKIIAEGLPKKVLADKEILRLGGLKALAMLELSEQADLPPCLMPKEVAACVE